MKTHDQIVKALLRRSAVRAEVERIEREEGELLDAFLRARHEAGLSQAQVAERMGTHAPAVARLERSLATGKHSWIFRSWEATVPDHGKPVLVSRLRWGC